MFVTTGIYFGARENEISHLPYFPHLFAGKPVDTSLLTKSIDKTEGSFLVVYSLWVWTKHDDMYPPLVSKRVVPLSKKSYVLPVHPSLPHSPPPVGRQPLIFLLSLVLHFSQCLIVASCGGSVVKNLPTNAADAGLIPGWARFSWRRNWQLTPVFLPGKSHGQSLAGSSPWGCKSQIRLSN